MSLFLFPIISLTPDLFHSIIKLCHSFLRKESNEKHIRKSIIQRKRKTSFHSIPTPKPLEELTMMDSFLFEAATEDVENAKIIAKSIIERTTGRKVNNLVIQAQKQLKGINTNKHGIRMDVYTTETNENNCSTCVYDIEPNNYYEKDLPRRNRFYQSLIDSKLLPTDTPFSQLPDVFSIWILPYDPFGDNRMLYTVKNMVEENNQIVYNDGVTKIFIYTKGTVGGSQKLKDLLTFLENSTPTYAVDEELMAIQKIIDTVKCDSETRKRYMGIMGVIDYERRDAFEAGEKLGIQTGQLQGAISNSKFMNLTKEQTKENIMKQFSLPENIAEDYLNLYW